MASAPGASEAASANPAGATFSSLPSLLLLFLAACASTAPLKKELADTEAQREALHRAYHQEREKTARLETENKGLLDSLSAKSSELSQTVASLTREKQALQQRTAGLELQLQQIQEAKQKELAQTKSAYENLVSSLKQEVEAGEVQISRLKDRLTVNLVEKILFDSGSARIKPGGEKVLARVAKILNGAADIRDKDIRIEGHTDNVPIGSALRDRFPSNWELSTSRATAVSRFLEKSGVDPGRLIAAGYGEHRPIASNDDPEGRAQNRRIEIAIVAREASHEPVPEAK